MKAHEPIFPCWRERKALVMKRSMVDLKQDMVGHALESWHWMILALPEPRNFIFIGFLGIYINYSPWRGGCFFHDNMKQTSAG